MGWGKRNTGRADTAEGARGGSADILFGKPAANLLWRWDLLITSNYPIQTIHSPPYLQLPNKHFAKKKRPSLHTVAEAEMLTPSTTARNAVLVGGLGSVQNIDSLNDPERGGVEHVSPGPDTPAKFFETHAHPTTHQTLPKTLENSFPARPLAGLD